ncbi:MAG: hypothetical protein IPG23_15865 [Burkholderiales bacterium]|nr:hypothetical protein [Burkholderiales bacterium]MBK6594069.1 hypothetical protein [Burkholderiales bacterium]
MFYMMPNPLFDNAFQSWIAAARDQATAQLIATASMQKAFQSRVVHDLESCTLMVEEQVDAVYLPVERSVARTCPSKRARKHGL